jgi:hypothetical protein
LNLPIKQNERNVHDDYINMPEPEAAVRKSATQVSVRVSPPGPSIERFLKGSKAISNYLKALFLTHGHIWKESRQIGK